MLRRDDWTRGGDLGIISAEVAVKRLNEIGVRQESGVELCNSV